MHFHGPKTVAATLALNTFNSISAPPVSSNGCGKALPAGLVPGGGSVNLTLNSVEGGGERRYLVHLPSEFSKANDKPAPLIIVLHAFGQQTSSMESITRFSEADTNTNYIAVYPEGINNVWLGDPGAPNSSVVDDRPFISDMLDRLQEMVCVDKSRVYTTGFSNGGGLSGLLACDERFSGRITAFSGVSAAYYTEGSLGYSLFEKEGCKPGGLPRRIPFLDIHGDSDMVIAYDGDNSGFDIDQNGIPDPDTLPVPTWLGDWADRNACPASSDWTIDGYLETGDVVNATSLLSNGNVTRSAWTCEGWSDVVVGYYVKELGHGWPSTVPLEGELEEFRRGPTTWNASTLLLEWFGRWSLSLE